MHTLIRAAIATFFMISIALGCQFQYDPASVHRFYREEGWSLPGIHDDDPHVTPNQYGAPPVGDVLRAIPGAKAYLLRRDEDHYVVEFPAQIFALDSERRTMRRILAKATILRWEINGRVVAYSYGLIRIDKAYKMNGKWVYDGELGCIFYGTFIDEKGDGVFRTMIPDTLRAEFVPAWAKTPIS
jgi:hypothetical protein